MKKITALLAVGSLALAACGSSSSASSSSSSAPAKTTASSSGGGYGKAAATNTTASNPSGSGAVAITMNDNYFGTKTITGKPGSTVKVTLTNKGSNQHNFKIDGQKLADADVAPGKTGHAVVKIPTSGTLQFYCEYHKGLGMVGTVKAS